MMNPALSLAFTLLFVSNVASAENAPVTTRPDGSYAVARLELSAGLNGSPQPLFVALRDGKLASLWFVGPIAGDKRLNIEKSSLVLTDHSLAGTVDLRTARGRQSPIIPAKLTLDLKLADGKLTGHYDLDMGKTDYKSAKGTATGTLSTKPAAADALTQGGWTSFWGSHGDMSADKQPPLIDDLSKAKPVWRSEAHVLTAYGNAPDSRYFTRALISGNGGGGSSPVVANNTVFVSFYVPSELSEPMLKNPFWERSYPTDDAFKKQMAELNANEQEINWVRNHFRPLADDHVVAIDAATGATKWRTILPRRSPNLQTHKHRGTSGVPLVAGKTLYVPNLASRLYALDADTGEVKWEFPPFDGMQKPAANANDGPPNPSPLLVADSIIWARGGQVYALDPATGREKWKAPGGYLMRWNNGGKDRLIVFAGKALACLDAASGKQLWSEATDLTAFAPLSAVVAGDVLLAAPALDKATNTFTYRGLKLSDTGPKEIWKAEPITPDENLPITVVGDRAYFLGKQEIRVLDVATGKKVVEKKFAMNGPGSNAWLGVVGDRLLFLPEGQHGTAHLAFLGRDLEPIGSFWLPGNTDTTAYNSQPIVYPLVDGRLFVRGGDGIYCWDLRTR